MAKISGTNIAATVVPFDTADTYPTHQAQYGKGGWKAVATFADLASIPAARLEEGSMAYVLSEKQPYVLADLANNVWMAFFATVSDVAAATNNTKVVTPASLSGLVANVTGAQTAITGLQTTTTSLQTANTTNTNNITGLRTDVTAAQTSITTLTTNTTGLRTDLTAAQTSITSLLAGGGTTNKVDKTTTFTVSGGLLSGGGDLSANRTISLTPATPSDVTAGTANNLVLTPVSISGLVTTVATNNDEVEIALVNQAASMINLQAMLVNLVAFK
jgi:hypothetical protein